MHEWEGGEDIPNGRLLRHLPSGRVLAVARDNDGYRAQLVEGGQDDETEELGRMAIGYCMLIGQGSGWTFRRRKTP